MTQPSLFADPPLAVTFRWCLGWLIVKRTRMNRAYCRDWPAALAMADWWLAQPTTTVRVRVPA